MQTRGKRLAGVLARVLLAVLLLAWLVGRQDVGRAGLQTSLARTLDHPVAALTGLALIFGSLLCSALRWQLLLQRIGLRLRVRRALGIYLIGHFFNAFLLGTTGGDLVKAVWATREMPDRKVEAAGSVILERLVGLAVLLVLAVVGMLVRWPVFVASMGVWGRTVLAGSLLALMGGGGAMLVLAGRTFLGRRYLAASAGWRRRFPRLERLRVAASACLQFSPAVAAAWGYSLLSHGCSILSWYAFGRALGLAVSFWDCLLLVPAILLVQSLPLTPGGVGLREWATVALFGVRGVAPAAALALALISFAGALCWSLVGGGVFAFLAHPKVDGPRAEVS